MKLIRFGAKNEERPGVFINGSRKDCSVHFDDWGGAFFNQNGLSELRKLLDRSGDTLPTIDADERWGSPIARPGMIMCIGLNYSDHAAESGMDIPEQPIIFMKATNTLVGPYDEVVIPKRSSKTDWEVELGVVLSRDVNYLDNEQEALDSIAGYCIVHDVSEREFQLNMGGQWVKGKSCPGFSPVGPYLVTPDEIDDVLDLNMHLAVNGQTMQSGNTSKMIFKPSYIIKYLSQYMLLEAGDLISTGTPPGVGLGMDPPTYLSNGDEVELSIERLGEQAQVFKNASK